LSDPLLSASLIVRNEERFLEGCLRSLAGRADEIVVVDTGSTDRSREIAGDLGARLVDHEWADDFAAARNAAIDAARGAWILYIDADERVIEFDHDAVLPQLADPMHACYRVLFRPAAGLTRYREYRLFRNHPELRFRGVIHESLLPALGEHCARTGLLVGDSPLALDHLGYDGDQSHKHERNLPLLRARLERDPAHVYSWDHLGNTLLGLGDEAGAEAAWRRAIDIVRATGRREASDSLSWLHLAQFLHDRKRDAPALLEEGCHLFPENHSLTCLRAHSLVKAGEHAAAMPAVRGAGFHRSRATGWRLARVRSRDVRCASARRAWPVCVPSRALCRKCCALCARRGPRPRQPGVSRKTHAGRDPRQGTRRGMNRLPALLFVAPILPAATGNGLAMRAGVFLDALAQDYAVTLLVVPVAGGTERRVSPFVATRTQRVVTVPVDGVVDPLWTLLGRIADPDARTTAFASYPRPAPCRYATPAYLAQATAVLEGERFDAVHVMRSYMVPYAEPFLMDARALEATRASLDLDDDEAATHLRLSALAQRRGSPRDATLLAAEAAKFERHEAIWLRRFQSLIACSDAHARRIAAAHPDSDITVVPNTVVLPSALHRQRDAERHLLFVGNLSYLPNVDGIAGFVRDVLPQLRARFGDDVVLRIAGSAPIAEIVALASLPGVELVVDPADLAPHYAWADLAVIPLTAGGGTRIKLIEAFAHGVPVVATTIGTEGVDARHGTHLLVADEPAAFAEACSLLLSDRGKRNASRRLHAVSPKRVTPTRLPCASSAKRWRRSARRLSFCVRLSVGTKQPAMTPSKMSLSQVPSRTR
jgi:glycosyltransferase involved in cell wall biosynthesis